MKSPSLTVACLVAVTGMAFVAADCPAQESSDAGVVRITDAVRPVAYTPNLQALAASGVMAHTDSGWAPTAAGTPCATRSGCGPRSHGSTCFGHDCPPGVVVWEGHGHRMTGFAPLDWITTLGLMTKGHLVSSWHNSRARMGHHDCESECPPEGAYGAYGCPPGHCHPNRCGPHGCGPHCACLAHPDPSRFGYLQPAGHRGIGHYSAAYPVDPWHFDQRDGRIYAAQGYGVPMAVPVAPNVEHTYNYSWGIPSTRLTPLSHMPSDSRRAVGP